MNIIDEHLGLLLLIFIIAAVVQMYLIRRYINNMADPLVFFAFMSSFSLALGYISVDSVELYIRIILYFCFFYLGFFIAMAKAAKVTFEPLIMRNNIAEFKMIVIIGSTLILLANLIIWMKSGVILFSEDPSLNKSLSYADGLGFVRRINWSFGVFVLISALYWYVWERSWSSIFWLGLVTFIAVSGGSKSSLLPIIFAFGLYFINPFRPKVSAINIPDRRVIAYFIFLSIFPVTIVLYAEQGSLDLVFNALIVRLFYFGDILLYWGQSDLRAYFSNFGFSDYILGTFGSVLGMLRLADYQTSLGSQFVQFTLSISDNFADVLGPNLPFYVRGELYFGYLIAPIHAIVVGWILGRIRFIFISYRGSEILHYTLASFFVCLSLTLPVEEGLFVGQAVDFLFVYLIVRFIVLLINSGVSGSRPQKSK